MLCQKCKSNEADTVVTKTINGSTKTEHLCHSCSNSVGSGFEELFFDFPFKNFISGLIPKNYYGESKSKRCPQCGLCFDEISKSGKIGCAVCYETFDTELLEVIQKLHGRAEHIGKIPQSAKAVDIKATGTTVSELDTLKEKLENAINEQNFEVAAEYRDRINEINQAGKQQY